MSELTKETAERLALMVSCYPDPTDFTPYGSKGPIFPVRCKVDVKDAEKQLKEAQEAEAQAEKERQESKQERTQRIQVMVFKWACICFLFWFLLVLLPNLIG